MQNFTPEDTRQTNSDVSGSKLSNEEQQEKPYDLTDEQNSEKNWFRMKLNVFFFRYVKMTEKQNSHSDFSITSGPISFSTKPFLNQ